MKEIIKFSGQEIDLVHDEEGSVITLAQILEVIGIPIEHAQILVKTTDRLAANDILYVRFVKNSPALLKHMGHPFKQINETLFSTPIPSLDDVTKMKLLAAAIELHHVQKELDLATEMYQKAIEQQQLLEARHTELLYSNFEAIGLIKGKE